MLLLVPNIKHVHSSHALEARASTEPPGTDGFVASESVKQAVKAGVDVIYHREFADREALDMLESAKNRVLVAPAIGFIRNTLHEAQDFTLDH